MTEPRSFQHAHPSSVDLLPGIPSFPVLVKWLLGGRTVLAVVTVIQASFAFARGLTPLDRYVAFVAVIMVSLSLAATAYGAYVIYLKARRPGPIFFLTQAATDLMLVTALVHFAAEREQGVWAALYVLVLAMYSLTMSFRGGVVMALLASSLFVANTWFDQPVSSLAPLPWLQIAIFTLALLLVVYVGHRLRVAAEEQSSLEIELEQIRLEADDILRNIHSGVLTVNNTGELVFINPMAEETLGIPAERFIGRSILAHLETLAPELHGAIVSGIGGGSRVARAEGMVTRGDGKTFPIGLSTTTFQRESETTPSVTAIFTDISGARALHELHLRAERLEAVAALSAALAHEIRNPLASIRSAVEQLTHPSKRADPDDRILGQLVLRESDRLNRLLGEFLDFSRVRASKFTTVNLRSIANDAVRIVRNHPECGSGIEIMIDGEPTPIEADEDLLHRVLFNLVLNGAQALKGQGKIVIRIDRPRADQLPTGADFSQPVRLRVSDNGPGIDPELRERLFQPFVSGRPGGSGLGLAIVQRAVEAHRGLVLVESAPSRGTTFTILLHAKPFMEDAA